MAPSGSSRPGIRPREEVTRGPRVYALFLRSTGGGGCGPEEGSGARARGGGGGGGSRLGRGRRRHGMLEPPSRPQRPNEPRCTARCRTARRPTLAGRADSPGCPVARRRQPALGCSAPRAGAGSSGGIRRSTCSSSPPPQAGTSSPTLPFSTGCARSQMPSLKLLRVEELEADQAAAIQRKSSWMSACGSSGRAGGGTDAARRSCTRRPSAVSRTLSRVCASAEEWQR